MLAMRAIGLRLRLGAVALGNALGDSLASATSSPPVSTAPSSQEEREAILALFRDGPREPSGSGYTEQEMLDGSQRHDSILSDRRVVIPWPGDEQPSPSRNSNFFGIEPSDGRGFLPDPMTASRYSGSSASYGDNVALHNEIVNNPQLKAQRDAWDVSMRQDMAVENVATRERNLASFRADAARALELQTVADGAAVSQQKWSKQPNIALAPVANFVTDFGIRVGRDYPTVGGLIQVGRMLTIGEGTNEDAAWAVAPLALGRFAKSAGKAIFGAGEAALTRTSTEAQTIAADTRYASPVESTGVPRFAKAPPLTAGTAVGRFDPEFAKLGLQGKVEASLQHIEQVFGSEYAGAIRTKLDKVSLQTIRSTDDFGEFLAKPKGATIYMNVNIGNSGLFANTLLHEVRHLRQFEKIGSSVTEWNKLSTSHVEKFATATNIWQGKKLGLTQQELAWTRNYYNKARQE
jgi:hypothetical protein